MGARGCRHSACACPVGPDEFYCSPACRMAAERDDPLSVRGCGCGHQGCLGHAGQRDLERSPEEPQRPAEPGRAKQARP